MEDVEGWMVDVYIVDERKKKICTSERKERI
jgi:hypothetical protein